MTHGIRLWTSTPTIFQEVRRELEWISTRWPEEAAVLHRPQIPLPRPKTRIDRVDLTLPGDQKPFEGQRL